MKLFNRYSCLFVGILASTTFLASPALANQNNEIIIINHFDKALQYTISVNHEVLPDLPTTFKLNVGDVATSKVVDIQKETYLRTADDEGHSGFWGVDVENNKTHIHGYYSKGLAYSWNEQTIIFCTPEDYKKNGHCV